MKNKVLLLCFILTQTVVHCQDKINELRLSEIQSNSIKKYWLKMIDNGLSQPVYIPVIVAKGKNQSPVLGLTAAIHGNELNGIRVVQKIIDTIAIEKLNGTIIAIPGLNTVSIPLHQRRYFDKEDINRNFPGRRSGNRSQQFAYQIKNKILSKLDFLIDMHTASFGRENSLYVRADMTNDTIKKMAQLQDADILLNSKGLSSFGSQSSKNKTMRAEAMEMNIPTITIEYGNPQVYQNKIIRRGTVGIINVLSWLKMLDGEIKNVEASITCKRSYWIFLDKGGYLEVTVDLKDQIKKGDLIGILRSPFGDIIKKYYSPEAGIVIGKSSNPINMSGGRIIHLGIIEKSQK